MTHRDSPWPDGAPCWADAQLDDLAAGRVFYAALLGWEVPEGPPEAGGYTTATLDGRAVAGLGPKPPGAEGVPAGWTTYFAAADAEESCARAQEVGGYVAVPPFDVLDSGRMALGLDAVGAPFGWWQAGSHRGFETYGENGAVCWSELHAPGDVEGRQFYADLFGWTFTEVGDGADAAYSAFRVPGLENSSGGIFTDAAVGSVVPPHWLVWFQVADCDVVAEAVAGLGGGVLQPPTDSETGRMAVLRGAQGERFGVIDTARTVGRNPLEERDGSGRTGA